MSIPVNPCGEDVAFEADFALQVDEGVVVSKKSSTEPDPDPQGSLKMYYEAAVMWIVRIGVAEEEHSESRRHIHLP